MVTRPDASMQAVWRWTGSWERVQSRVIGNWCLIELLYGVCMGSVLWYALND
jgi:hypothetical protein